MSERGATVNRHPPAFREGRTSVAKPPSFATSCTLMPAERAILPPPPGRSSTLCTVEPVGMKRIAASCGTDVALAPDST